MTAAITGNNGGPFDQLQRIVDGRYRIQETEALFPCPIRRIEIATGLRDHADHLIGHLPLGGRLAIVSDEITHDVMGGSIAACLPNAQEIVLTAPKADDVVVEALIDRSRNAEALIVVGAGTLNDLCKQAAHRTGRPYAVFATAPSMNGYTTKTASISKGGEKLSLPSTPPIAAFFDLDVLANAPMRSIRSGVGDSLCRSTAEVDWRLAHLLFDHPFMATPFALQTDDEAALLARLDRIETRKIDAIESLTRLLVLGGLGMLIAGSSAPGSQGEHLISHYIDMFAAPHPGTRHGEQVGLASWTMANLQADILHMDVLPPLRPPTISSALLRRRYGPFAPSCKAALAAKEPVGRDLDRLNDRLATDWPAIRKQLLAIALPTQRLKTAFEKAGVALMPEALGINPSFYRKAAGAARGLRDRYSMLDLAAGIGALEPSLDRLCGTLASDTV